MTRLYVLEQGGSKHGRRTFGIFYEDCYAWGTSRNPQAPKLVLFSKQVIIHFVYVCSFSQNNTPLSPSIVIRDLLSNLVSQTTVLMSKYIE